MNLIYTHPSPLLQKLKTGKIFWWLVDKVLNSYSRGHEIESQLGETNSQCLSHFLPNQSQYYWLDDLVRTSNIYTVCFFGFLPVSFHYILKLKNPTEVNVEMLYILCILFHFRINENKNWGIPKKHSVCYID